MNDSAEGRTRRVALTVEFDGSDFRGWQRQPFGERTVQGAIEAAFDALPWPRGTVHAAGRTDAGVHALAMVAHVDVGTSVADERLRLALNAHLPPDVAILAVATVAPDFEAQYACRYRRYLYRARVVRGRPRGLALDRNRVLMVHRTLDVPAMQAATALFVGTRDFSSLATQETRSRVRTVHLCELREEDGELRLHVAADGFLRGMVRAVQGTLLRVGRGATTIDEVREALEARDRRRAGAAAPPHGLYFAEAGYRPWDPAVSERAVTGRTGAPPPPAERERVG